MHHLPDRRQKLQHQKRNLWIFYGLSQTIPRRSGHSMILCRRVTLKATKILMDSTARSLELKRWITKVTRRLPVTIAVAQVRVCSLVIILSISIFRVELLVFAGYVAFPSLPVNLQVKITNNILTNDSCSL